MKKRIRILSLMLALLSVFTFASCGTSELTKKFTRGTVSGDVYTSNFSGIQFTKPSDWTFLKDDEIAELQGTASEMFDEEAFDRSAEASVIDVYAQNADGTNNVNITFGKGAAFTDVDKTLTASVDELKSMYEGMGWTVTAGETETVTLAGKEFKMVKITTFAGSVTMEQYCFVAKIGVYICTIACTTLGTYSAAQFEAMFAGITEEKA